MHDPWAALLIFGIASALAAVIFWPRRGLLSRLQARGVSERTRVEDALKHLYDCEYQGLPCTAESLAGVLGISRGRSMQLLARLKARGLARSAGAMVELTEPGRLYALQVIRSHRLWERYLADRTGLEPSEWHAEAEQREHTLTPSEADALSASLGHPRYDPHGDPIPGADGWMPPAAGIPLTTLSVGDAAAIVHLEDEPPEAYDRLVRAGLGPGTRLEVLSSSAGELRIRASGREHVLDPVVASKISVERLPTGGGPEPDVETLAVLRPGESARVVRISAACQGPQRRRLLDLGVVPGTRITARLRSAAGDPVAYEIRGALIALRREQAEWILVRREDPAAAAVQSGAGSDSAHGVREG